MGGLASRSAIPSLDRQSLSRLETHFIAQEIYRRDDVAARQAKLASVIADDIIPRLLRLHTEGTPEAPPLAPFIEALAPSSSDIDALADIVLGNDLEAAATYVMLLRDRGLAMETLFVDLLEPTARHLGVKWDEDEIDFIDVTLGVARLQKLLAIFNSTHDLPALDTHRTVLMAMAPGDQHYFGVAMVTRFLRAAGWRVQTEDSATAVQIGDLAAKQWFAVAGLTMGSEGQIESLRSAIAELRARSQNQSIGIMVGGPAFTAQPSLVSEVGADATAPSAPTAVLVAQKLFDLQSANWPLSDQIGRR